MLGRYFPNVIFLYDNYEDSNFLNFLEEITPLIQKLGSFYRQNPNPFTTVSREKLLEVEYLENALADQTNYLFIYPILPKRQNDKPNKLPSPVDIQEINVLAGFEQAKNKIINLIYHTALLNQRPSNAIQTCLKFYKSIPKKDKMVASELEDVALHFPKNG